jgi:peptidoglycan/xylan/chitin deacetylase (PgdA/CDA1 family)
MRFVTTSWDDGHPDDLKLAELLHSVHLPGTFYVLPNTEYKKRKTLSMSELRSLHSAGFEIGGHSVTHPKLPKLTRKEIAHEVRECKQVLEEALGEDVNMFCYPSGRFDAGVIQEVREAGYKGARTIRMFSVAGKFDAFAMPVTLQAYPHSVTSYLKNFGRNRNVAGFRKYMARLRKTASWVDLGKAFFDEMMQNGGIWHLYGHSWEIEELGIWEELRELLQYVSQREGVSYVTNGQLVS